jgi:hypothetical protein
MRSLTLKFESLYKILLSVIRATCSVITFCSHKRCSLLTTQFFPRYVTSPHVPLSSHIFSARSLFLILTKVNEEAVCLQRYLKSGLL